VVRHLALDQQEVGLEHAQVTGDVPAQIGGRGLSQTVGFGPGHRHEILAARQQRRQTPSLGVGGRAGREDKRPPHLGQHAGIHPVGLGQPTGGASKVAGLPGIDQTIGDAGAGQSVKKRPLVAARRLQHDQAGAGASRKARELLPGRRHAFPLAAGQPVAVDPALGDIHADDIDPRGRLC
jgi:hypothetical protein